MLENLNPYNQLVFESSFSKTDLYKKIKQDYKIVSFSKFFSDNKITNATPRQMYGESWFSVTSFYYLHWLLEKNPTTIFDLGCGWNIFKKYIPNIVGIGAEPVDDKFYYADQHDYVDADFVQGHQEYFESVFSINSLHFVELSELQNQIKNFYSMIAPQGRGFLALNLWRMVERENSQIKNYSIVDLEKYVRTQLYNLNIDFLVVDIDFKIPDEWMDGNIRLVMQK